MHKGEHGQTSLLMLFLFFLNDYDYISHYTFFSFLFDSFQSSLMVLQAKRIFLFTFIRQILFFYNLFFYIHPIIFILLAERNAIECKEEKNPRTHAFMQVSDVILQLLQIVTHMTSCSMFVIDENTRKIVNQSVLFISGVSLLRIKNRIIIQIIILY
jgi:hypothetical protein